MYERIVRDISVIFNEFRVALLWFLCHYYSQQMSAQERNGHTWNWLSLKSQREYNCNQSLFLQSLLQKLTTTKERTLIRTSSLFQKRPLVVTMKWKLMLHQEIQLKYPQIQTVSLKIAVSVKCQNSVVIQVCKNMSCFSCYRSIVQYYI